jgi:hypothetical protein
MIWADTALTMSSCPAMSRYTSLFSESFMRLKTEAVAPPKVIFIISPCFKTQKEENIPPKGHKIPLWVVLFILYF